MYRRVYLHLSNGHTFRRFIKDYATANWLFGMCRIYVGCSVYTDGEIYAPLQIPDIILREI